MNNRLFRKPKEVFGVRILNTVYIQIGDFESKLVE